MRPPFYLLTLCLISIFFACEDAYLEESLQTSESTFDAVWLQFGEKLPTAQPFNYANQDVPSYITKDNTAGNVITDEAATLGRVLFYDKNLSSNKTISCSSCHQQAKGFGDDLVQSEGVNGLTGRHSMRLINARFSEETQFFWDERAATLEEQTTMPIQDHAEMGFSGMNGDPSFDDLVERLDSLEFYGELFTWAFGDGEISEERVQDALAQFIRSIQSFDSNYDMGRATTRNDGLDFDNLSELENEGKRIFLLPPPEGGAGCAGCHRPPEFDIDPQTGNNGVITSLTSDADITNTRAPSLRNLFDDEGNLLGPLMHDGSFATMEEVVRHYDDISSGVPGIDRRINGQQLNLTEGEIEAVVAFLKTLSGSNVLMDERWSDPF